MKELTNRFMKIDPLYIVQILFIAIPLVILGLAYFMLGADPMTKILEEPVLTIQAITVFSLPFGCLCVKHIRECIEIDAESGRIPLLILACSQLLTFNFITLTLLMMGILKEYGTHYLRKGKKKNSVTDQIPLITSVFLLALSLITLFFRFRLNMF